MPPLSRLLRTALFAATLIAGCASGAQAGPASHLIERFNLTFIDIVRADDRQVVTGQPGRYRRLSDHLNEYFDFNAMMARAAGPYWTEARELDRAQAADAFLRVTVATYLSRFETYSGEYFEILGEEQARDGAVRVLARLIRPGRFTVPVTYVVRPAAGGSAEDAKIVDVIFVRGRSEVAERASDFADTLSRRGLTGLTARLNDQADRIVADLRAPLQRDANQRSFASTN